MIIGWVVVFAVRLFPWRPPNVEPVMATLMPFAKGYGPVPAFFFGFLSIALFDIALGMVGSWTFLTAMSYGLVGVLSYYMLRKKVSRGRFVLTGIVGTLAYDAVTGVLAGPILFGMPLMQAFIGQIPFTVWHLVGTIGLSYILSPALYTWVVTNPSLETPVLRKRFGLS